MILLYMFFFLMLRRPPRSTRTDTLFPYTTLFRSSCIRDYIHVEDLCDAHLLALGRLAAGGESARYNLGNGNGFSVLEVLEMARHVTGHPIPLVVAGPRDGDPPKLVAHAMLARKVLQRRPLHTDLEKIVRDAWRWVLPHAWWRVSSRRERIHHRGDRGT